MLITSKNLNPDQIRQVAEMTGLEIQDNNKIKCFPDDLVALRQAEVLLFGGVFSPLPTDEMSLKLSGLSSHDCQMSALLGENWEEIW